VNLRTWWKLLTSPNKTIVVETPTGTKPLDDPEVQAQLRAQGIDPAFVGAAVGGEHAGKDPKALLEGLLESPEMQEQLRKAGLDPAVLEEKLESGEVKVEGDKTTFTTHFTTKLELPGEAPSVPLPAAPVEEHAPSSDDGDDVWKSGKL
jgi:hypothetical protein